MAGRRSRSKGELVAAGSSALAPLSSEWEQRLAQHAANDAAAVTGGAGWGFISTKGGMFRFQEEPLDSPLKAIILGAVPENLYYEDDFDPDVIQAPTCFAVGKVGKGSADLAPPEDLETRQHSRCEGCPQNAFGSANRGRGKACGNKVRIVLLPADNLEATVLSEIEGARLRVPPTSLKAFNRYCQMLTKAYRRPLFSVVTAIHIEPDDRTQLAVRFEPEAEIRNPELLEILERRVEEASQVLEEHPPRQSAEPQREREPARGRSRAAAPLRARSAARPRAREEAAPPPPLPEAGAAKSKPPAKGARPAASAAASAKGKPTPRAHAGAAEKGSEPKPRNGFGASKKAAPRSKAKY